MVDLLNGDVHMAALFDLEVMLKVISKVMLAEVGSAKLLCLALVVAGGFIFGTFWFQFVFCCVVLCCRGAVPRGPLGVCGARSWSRSRPQLQEHRRLWCVLCVCSCMCVCMRAYVCACVHTCVHTCLCVHYTTCV